MRELNRVLYVAGSRRLRRPRRTAGPRFGAGPTSSRRRSGGQTPCTECRSALPRLHNHSCRLQLLRATLHRVTWDKKGHFFHFSHRNILLAAAHDDVNVNVAKQLCCLREPNGPRLTSFFREGSLAHDT